MTRFFRCTVIVAWFVLLAVVSLPVSLLRAQEADEAGWVTAGANAQRTSWTPEEVGPPFRPVWYRVIEPYISMNVQVIAAEGKLFLATARGLYAFNAADGAIDWVYPTEMPLGHSPTYDKGVLYVGGFDRKLHCIDAKSGRRLWTFDQARAGYRTCPLVAEGLVAGHMGYLGLEKLAGQPASADVQARLDKLLSWRAEKFSKDTPFPSTGPYNKAQPSSHPNRLNISRNFIHLTPELGEYLHEHAVAKVAEAVDEYNRVGPYWFVARYEGCLQEATIQNLYDTFALVAAKAWILQEPREELVKYLDVPGFARGDCFYIHNLISTLEASVRR